MAFPMAWPSSGRRLGPKMTSAMIATTTISGHPIQLGITPTPLLGEARAGAESLLFRYWEV